MNMELYFSHKPDSKRKTYDFFCFQKSISNHFYSNYLSKKLNILPARIIKNLIILNRIFSKYFNKLEDHEILFGKTRNDRDIHNIFDKTQTSISFTHDDYVKGWKKLNALGIDKNSKYICLFARDSEYLKSINLVKDYSKHDYRNEDINIFLKSANFFTEKGFKVVRIGSVVGKKLESSNKMIIDYSCSEHKSDFMDFFICANCSYAFGTSSGAIDICHIFRKPIGVIHLPVFDFQSWSDKFYIITKKHFSQKLNRNLKLSEILNITFSDLQSTQGYKMHQIDLINLSDEDLRDFAEEMLNFFENNYSDENQKKLQNKFKKNYLEIMKNSKLNNYHGQFNANMSDNFLLQNPEFLE